MTKVVPSADGVPVAYEVQGEGSPALVFVHGWSCDRRYWDEQLGPFSRDYRIVALDLAGHGDSGGERESWTIAAFGGDVAAVVETLDLERVLLIGHSMGGDVIVEAARRLPGRVEGLVWIDAYRCLGTPRTPEQLEALLEPLRADFKEGTRRFVRGLFPPGADPSLVERIAQDMAAAPPAVALPSIQAAMTYDREVTVRLRQLNLPVVALNPDNPPTDTDSLALHDVGAVLMSGVGHFPMVEDPLRFNSLLRKVIEELLR